MRILSILMFCAGLAACGTEAPAPAQGPKMAAFFDLGDYFEAEAARLGDRPAHKTVTLDGQREEDSSAHIAWRKDFAPFIGADINKSVWYDKYSVDSLWEAGQLAGLHYRSRDSSLAVSALALRYGPDGQVQHIRVDKQRGSRLYDSRERLEYSAAEGYRIEQVQRILGGKARRLLVEVRF